MGREVDIRTIEDSGNIDIRFASDTMSDVDLHNLAEATRYPKRRKDGQAYSDLMNSKLENLDVPESVKDVIDSFFEKTQFFLEGGKWRSGYREAVQLVPNDYVSQELIDSILQHIDGYISQSYIDN